MVEVEVENLWSKRSSNVADWCVPDLWRVEAFADTSAWCRPSNKWESTS